MVPEEEAAGEEALQRPAGGRRRAASAHLPAVRQEGGAALGVGPPGEQERGEEANVPEGQPQHLDDVAQRDAPDDDAGRVRGGGGLGRGHDAPQVQVDDDELAPDPERLREERLRVRGVRQQRQEDAGGPLRAPRAAAHPAVLRGGQEVLGDLRVHGAG